MTHPGLKIATSTWTVFRRVALGGLCLIVAIGSLAAILMQIKPADAMISPWNPAEITKIANRNGHTCAVADGQAYCWGDNQYGQLGNNNTGLNSLTPVPVYAGGALAGKTVTDIAAGADRYTCAIADGKPYCWGRNRYGQLGNGSTTDSAVPVAVTDTGVLSGKTVTKIATGDGHACVIANDGKPYCWGVGGNGRLGNNSQTGSTVPIATVTSGALSSKTATQIQAASSSTCVLAGELYCWGNNQGGRLGDGTLTDRWVPTAVDTSGALAGKVVTQLGSGASNATVCALADGKPYCWGWRSGGALGDGDAGDPGTGNDANHQNDPVNHSATPVAVNTSGVLSGKTIVSVTSGNLHSCALDTAGKAYCWGVYYTGGSPSLSTLPVEVDTSGVLSGVTVKYISSGDTHCAIGTNNRAYCWGNNSKGEIGDNSTATRSRAVAVLANDNLTSSAWRLYQNNNSSNPGSPLAGSNAAAELTTRRQTFRLRVGVENSDTSGTPIAMTPGSLSLKLQYAAKTTATCKAQTTGFTDVTTSSAIAWHTNSGVTNGAAISTSPNDPVTSRPIVHQTYQSANGPFTNSNDIPNGSVGIWDFSLEDNSAPTSTSYCFRIIYNDGSNLEAAPSSYPEVKSAEGVLSIGIVDAAGTAVVDPTYPLNNTLVRFGCQTTTGALGEANQRIRIANSLTANGWNATIAPTDGMSALWMSDNNEYDFNDPSGSPAGCNPGSDGDSVARQLTVDPSSLSVTPQSGCTSTGINAGTSAGFAEGSIDAITLVSGSASTPLDCYWDVTGIGLEQRIPAAQAAGVYDINMTLTVVAQ